MKKKITTITETIDEAGILISRTTEVTEEPQLHIKDDTLYCGEAKIGEIEEMITSNSILGTVSTIAVIKLCSQVVQEE